MAIVKMDKVSIIGLENDKNEIMDTLMKLGTVEISNIDKEDYDEEMSKIIEKDGNEDEVSIVEADINKVKTVLENLDKYDTTKKALFEPKRVVNKSDYEDIIHNSNNIWETVKKVSEHVETLASLKNEENKLTNLIITLKPWEKLSIPLETSKTKTTEVFLGVIPSLSDIEDARNQLNSEVAESYFEIIESDSDQYYVIAICYKDYSDQALSILKKYGFTNLEFSDLQGTAKENIEKSKARIKEIIKERKEIIDRITDKLPEKQKIELLYDYLCMERDKKRTLSNFVKTDKVFMLKGWIPVESKEAVEKKIVSEYDCIIEFEKPGEDEETPVLLKNNSFVKPFEFVTELYNLPSSKSFDSNWIMAPFYFVFFGLMLSDAGYGIIIALVTGIVLARFEIKGTLHKLIKLLFFGGISTTMWGIVFGGWFGNIFEILSGTTPDLFKPHWFNPLDDPMRLLIWSLIFGGIQIYVGMALNAFQLIKDGKTKDAIYDVGSWYLFLTGLIMLLLGGNLALIGKYLAIIGAIMLILTQGRNEKNIALKIVKGVGSLYNVTGYLSDLLSYSRLLALGMATGVIASVVNTIGALFGFNILGIVIFIIVFIIGHVFNILINLLGAYVHSSRLMYVEFFSKYFVGGGKEFKPFKRNTKYVEIR